MVIRPGKLILRTQEGTAVVEETIEYLERVTPASPLLLNENLV